MSQPGQTDREPATDAKTPQPRTYGCIAAFGLLLALIGGLFLLADHSFATRSRPADGVVTGFEGINPANVLVTYTDSEGDRHTFNAGSNSNLALEQDERVRVLYDPVAPGTATVDSFGSRSLIPWSLLGFGLLLAVLAIASILKLRRQQG